MPLVLHRGQALFFVHVPKAGGTSVEIYLERRFGPLCAMDRNKRLGLRGTGLITPATHLAACDLAEFIPANADLVFTLVREPVGKLKSEYRYQTGVSRMSRLSFSTWLHVMLACLRLEPRIYENHIRPQSEIVPEACEVFHLERDGVAQIIRRLDEVTGEPRPDLTPEHKNKRPQAPIRLHRQDVALIEQVFAGDYTRFGFARIAAEDLPDDRLAGLRALFARLIAPLIVWRQRLRWVL